MSRISGEQAVARFDSEAQALFYEWLGELEHRLRVQEMDATPAYQSHLAKYRSLMPSLALLIHLLDGASPSDGIPLSCGQRAAAWCELLEAHARKVYSPELDGGLSAAHSLASKIR